MAFVRRMLLRCLTTTAKTFVVVCGKSRPVSTMAPSTPGFEDLQRSCATMYLKRPGPLLPSTRLKLYVEKRHVDFRSLQLKSSHPAAAEVPGKCSLRSIIPERLLSHRFDTTDAARRICLLFITYQICFNMHTHRTGPSGRIRSLPYRCNIAHYSAGITGHATYIVAEPELV